MKSDAFRLRASHALWAAFPDRSAMRRFSPNFTGHPHAALQPCFSQFGLFRFRSPLLAESLLISFPALLRWFTSRSIAPPHCLPSRVRCTSLNVRVTPFGYSRISGCLLLPATFRGLPRPSSPSSPSRHPPQTYSRLTILPFSLPSLLLVNQPQTASSLRSLILVLYIYHALLGQNRVELLTPALSERCSNQLSYCPVHGDKGVRTPDPRLAKPVL